MRGGNTFASLAAGTRFCGQRNQEARDLFSGRKKEEERKAVNLLDWMSDAHINENLNEEDSDSDDNTIGDADDDVGDNQAVRLNKLDKEEEINSFRNRLHIKVTGNDVAAPVPTFSEMEGIQKTLRPALIKNIEDSKWKDPTPIQMQAIPCLLEGRDVLASAPTGSGKTAAFVIPALSLLHSPPGIQDDVHQQPKKKRMKNISLPPSNVSTGSHGSGIRVLILAPTRELAEQIHREATRLCHNSSRRCRICLLSKKLSANLLAHRDSSWSEKQDILVATPLRLLSLIREEKVINLSSLEMIILDEADRLFELQGRDSVEEMEEGKGQTLENEQRERIRTSFLSQVDEILAECPSSHKVQRALFSATVGPFVQELADGFLNNYVRIRIGNDNTGAGTINQRLLCVGREDGKLLAIRQLIQEGLKPPVLIFMQSIHRAKELFKELIYDGINVEVMHAERSNAQREEVIRRFRTGDIWVLICTDLMARGVDFKGVNMVINYDLPQSAVAYIHRIGRTGRAGRRGEAVTLFTEHDLPNIRAIANVVKASGCEVPDWMFSIKALNTKEKKKLRLSAPKRRKISTELATSSTAAPNNLEAKNDGTRKRKRRGRN